jgi:hypothetical protein
MESKIRGGVIPIATRVFLSHAAVCLTVAARYSRTFCARGCPTCNLARITRIDGTVPDASWATNSPVARAWSGSAAAPRADPASDTFASGFGDRAPRMISISRSYEPTSATAGHAATAAAIPTALPARNLRTLMPGKTVPDRIPRKLLIETRRTYSSPARSHPPGDSPRHLRAGLGDDRGLDLLNSGGSPPALAGMAPTSHLDVVWSTRASPCPALYYRL